MKVYQKKLSMSSTKFRLGNIFLVLKTNLNYNRDKSIISGKGSDMENELKDITSKRIKELRTKSDLTMEALAKKIGVSKSTIAKWENGYVDNMRQDMIMKLANVFNVSPLYILGYNEDEISREETFKLLYSQLSDDQKTVIDNMLTALSSKK